MLPPKKCSFESKIINTSNNSSLQTQALAISRIRPDAYRPKSCSNSDSDSKTPLKISRTTIQSPRSAARILRKLMSRSQEELWILALCPGKKILGVELLFRGTADSCQAHPRDIFRYLCLANASCFIVAHNHPSQDPEPSENDWQFTQRLSVAASIFGISLIDHLVVTKSNHRSLAALRPQLFVGSSEPAPAPIQGFSSDYVHLSEHR